MSSQPTEIVEECVAQADGTVTQHTERSLPKNARVMRVEEGEKTKSRLTMEEEEGDAEPEKKKKKKSRLTMEEEEGAEPEKRKKTRMVMESVETLEEEDDPKSKIAFLKAQANYDISVIKSELARKIMELSKE